jgi:2-polyprenyl-3-methyl-5-hydroxy-6-metoxy-1,4-benzoquinol methylase
MFGDLAGRRALRWLDVGAGFGELLEAVSRIFPEAVVTGIEPNGAKRRAAAGRGLALTDEGLDTLPQGNYDVVSVMNVWSHLPDPVEFFAHIASLLNDDGLVLVQTGNGGDLERAETYPDALFLPDHLSFAGERHVVGILERIGFQVEDVERNRVDTPTHALQCIIKRMLGRPPD